MVSWGVGGAFDMTKEKDPDSPRNPPAAARLPKWKRDAPLPSKFMADSRKKLIPTAKKLRNHHV